MFIRKRIIRPKRRRPGSNGLSVKDMLQILSSLILPLLLGGFTIFITMDQRSLARIDRNEDKNESRQQRQQEWAIAIMKQDAQYKGANDRYQDEILVAYINQIGDLLKENNGSLTSNHLTATLARVKTLNAFRQLDGSRKRHVLRFLHESGQLATTPGFVPLDVRGAKLNNIDFNESAWSDSFSEISLPGVRLQSCKFPESNSLITVNFGSTFILNVTFSHSKLVNVNFSYSDIRDTNISSAKLDNVNFAFAKLDNVNFSSTEIIRTNFSSAKLIRINCTSTKLIRVNFSSAELIRVNFSSSELTNVNFSSAKLTNVNFSFVELLRVNFSSARLTNVSFTSAKINNADFSSSRLGNDNHDCYFHNYDIRFFNCSF
jgi:uncharacterized protein YjbI with pentapeptide repeats